MGSKTTSLDSAVEEITAVAAESGTGMTAKANALSPTQRMGVIRYLQLKKGLSSGIKAVMRKKYPAEVHIYAEWEELLESTLNRKVE